MKRNLTFSQDRLAAIAGIVATMARSNRGKYCAGHWDITMPASLLWRSPVAEERSWFAPSWSWINADDTQVLEYPILYMNIYIRIQYEIEVVGRRSLPVSTKAPYGAVASGELHLRGHVRHVQSLGTLYKAKTLRTGTKTSYACSLNIALVICCGKNGEQNVNTFYPAIVPYL